MQRGGMRRGFVAHAAAGLGVRIGRGSIYNYVVNYVVDYFAAWLSARCWPTFVMGATR
ncbi:hypothetical protein GGTG_01963 [Gaeumannomyces tritici R3-111a-1]|uniref:Uncharacterized protein n=1 Tax=Gaeumannomyces tritici (strain R3-111a-1) TaxID=644352 RepID=J3NL22_GAET3|nr:hypothetical protein GGTG_01963 [Gaeumannomyces tritici R3-111a-1]EJT81989.1 hypothetical protein GGTG_01963 [Gaeumannomyces tritici R3-111a-1]